MEFAPPACKEQENAVAARLVPVPVPEYPYTADWLMVRPGRTWTAHRGETVTYWVRVVLMSPHKDPCTVSEQSLRVVWVPAGKNPEAAMPASLEGATLSFVPAAPGPFMFDVIVNGGEPRPAEPLWVKDRKTE